TDRDALEILRLRDFYVLFAIDGNLDAHIGIGKVHALGALLGDAQRGDKEVNLVADEIGDAVGTCHRHEIDFDPHVFGQQLRYVGVEAIWLVLLVHDAEGREVDEHADVDRPALLNLLEGLCLERRAPEAGREGQACRERKCCPHYLHVPLLLPCVDCCCLIWPSTARSAAPAAAPGATAASIG